ncbi:hypothetical protein FBU59_000084 [Linderina macrospora]|uniref:Uncharacterized protein n=1 Tax=Linderina macrospora TaxID=4868 RepID=A0ACC1JHK6_9FUNG|nr:hypothetical protein FBU59_000084 [Linderina macrospora]
MPAALTSRPPHFGMHTTETTTNGTTELASADSQTAALVAPPMAMVGGRPLVVHLRALHQKASRALILGQGAAAWNLCREAIQYCNIEKLTEEYGEEQARQLSCRLWILYICVLSSLTELAASDGQIQVRRTNKDTAPLEKMPGSVRQVWDTIMHAFGGYAGNVDSEVLVPTVLLCLKLRDAKAARDIVEAWLATLSDDTMYMLQSSNGGTGKIAQDRQQRAIMVQASYMRVCELYTLHILPQLNDFDSAYTFLDMSTVVSASTKDGFVKRLDSLRNPTPPKKPAKQHRSKPKKAKKPKASKTPAIEDTKTETETEAAKPVEPTKEVAAVEAAAESAAGPAAVVARPKLPSLAAVQSRAATNSRTRTRPAVKTRSLVRRPRGIVQIAYDVVKRLFSRWGFTLFTLAIVVAVLRLVMQRFRLPPILNAITCKLWSTWKMGTQVTYI